MVSFTCSTTVWFSYVIFENLKKMMLEIHVWLFLSLMLQLNFLLLLLRHCSAFSEFSWFDSFVPPLLQFLILYDTQLTRLVLKRMSQFPITWGAKWCVALKRTHYISDCVYCLKTYPLCFWLRVLPWSVAVCTVFKRSNRAGTFVVYVIHR